LRVLVGKCKAHACINLTDDCCVVLCFFILVTEEGTGGRRKRSVVLKVPVLLLSRQSPDRRFSHQHRNTMPPRRELATIIIQTASRIYGNRGDDIQQVREGRYFDDERAPK